MPNVKVTLEALKNLNIADEVKIISYRLSIGTLNDAQKSSVRGCEVFICVGLTEGMIAVPSLQLVMGVSL